MNTDRIAVETPEEKEALDAIPSCTCAKDKRIAELESELACAVKIIDDGDRYSNNDIGYRNSPYCADVREFLFKHGVISEQERPILKSHELLERK
jgi:hypothetical protein